MTSMKVSYYVPCDSCSMNQLQQCFVRNRTYLTRETNVLLGQRKGMTWNDPVSKGQLRSTLQEI